MQSSGDINHNVTNYGALNCAAATFVNTASRRGGASKRSSLWNACIDSTLPIPGSASVSLSPRLCTRLPGVRSSACLRPRRLSATAFVVYVSACRSTYRECYHRRPSLPGGCCIILSGTVCRRQYDHRRHCQFSAVDWRLNFLPLLQVDQTRYCC